MAITEICKDMECFHQTGRRGESGYHFFEMWQLDEKDKSAIRKIEELMPQIHILAEKKYNEGFVSFE